MTGSVTISLPSLSAINIGGSRRAEAAEVYWAVENAMRQMVSRNFTANPVIIGITDRQGNTAGSLTWTPFNSA